MAAISKVVKRASSNSGTTSSYKDIPSSNNIFHIISTHNTNNRYRATTTSFSPKLTQLWLRAPCRPSTTGQVGMVVVEEEDNKSKCKLL